MTPSDETAGRDGRVVSHVIDALIAGRKMRPEDVYRAVGITKSTYYNRMTRGDWKVTELLAIAEVLDEPISSFLDGLGGRFTRGVTTPSTRGCMSPTRPVYEFEGNVVASTIAA